jgi:DNA-binding GntR family transcriptional regulator
MSATTDDGQGIVASTHQRARSAILNGELEAGLELSQVELAERLGVSRTPLREAIRMLQREGLVEVGHHRKKLRIAPFSVEDLEQLYALRIQIEPFAAHLSVPHLSPEDLEVIDKTLAEMDEFAEREDARGWEGPHREFHQRLVRHGGERLVSAASELADHAERYRRVKLQHAPRAWSIGRAEHAEIAVAARAGDGQTVMTLLADHFARTALTVIPLVSPEHDPRAVRDALRFVKGRGTVDSSRSTTSASSRQTRER